MLLRLGLRRSNNLKIIFALSPSGRDVYRTTRAAADEAMVSSLMAPLPPLPSLSARSLVSFPVRQLPPIPSRFCCDVKSRTKETRTFLPSGAAGPSSRNSFVVQPKKKRCFLRKPRKSGTCWPQLSGGCHHICGGAWVSRSELGNRTRATWFVRFCILRVGTSYSSVWVAEPHCVAVALLLCGIAKFP